MMSNVFLRQSRLKFITNLYQSLQMLNQHPKLEQNSQDELLTQSFFPQNISCQAHPTLKPKHSRSSHVIDMLFEYSFADFPNSYDSILRELHELILPTISDYLSRNRHQIRSQVRKRPRFIPNPKAQRLIKLRHSYQPNNIHTYTGYLQINQNIRRLETPDQLFNYHFSEHLRDKFKLDVNHYSREQWRSPRGVQLMLDLLERYSINKDIVHKYATFVYIVGKADIFSDPTLLRTIIDSPETQYKLAQLQIRTNPTSLHQILFQLGSHYLRERPPNIVQPTALQPVHINLHIASQLSYKCFQSNSHLRPAQAFMCARCFGFQCNCTFPRPLSAVRDLLILLNLLQPLRKNDSKQRQTALKTFAESFLWALAQSACSPQCFKLLKQSPQDADLIEEYAPLDFNDDLCLLARRHNYDCLTLFVIARQRHAQIREFYLQKLIELQRYWDQLAGLGDPHSACFIYRPCSHSLDFQCKQCHCTQHTFCSKLCDCSAKDCKKKQKVGCNCQGWCNREKCECRKLGLECDPMLCKCLEHAPCLNMRVLLNDTQPTWIGNSTVCGGLGLFARTAIASSDLVAIYMGEVLNVDEEEVRDQFDDTNVFYMYQIEDVSIDSRFCGNESRFINHSKFGYNLEAQQIYSQGRWNIILVACRNISKGEELLVNYDVNNMLDKNKHKWVDSKNRYMNYYQDTYIKK